MKKSTFVRVGGLMTYYNNSILYYIILLYAVKVVHIIKIIKLGNGPEFDQTRF